MDCKKENIKTKKKKVITKKNILTKASICGIMMPVIADY